MYNLACGDLATGAGLFGGICAALANKVETGKGAYVSPAPVFFARKGCPGGPLGSPGLRTFLAHVAKSTGLKKKLTTFA